MRLRTLTACVILCCCAAVLAQSRSRSSQRSPQRGGQAETRHRTRSASGSRSSSRHRSRSNTARRNSTDATTQIECSLNKPDALSECVTALLLDKRAEVARLADPLDIPDTTEGIVTVSDARVYGLSCYNIDRLKLTFPESTKIAVDATLSWQNLRADLSVRVRDCARLIFRTSVCASISARPLITVARTVGTLKTTLSVDINNAGKLSVTPSGTDVNVDFAGVDVTANIQSTVGKHLNRILGDPASPLVTKFAKKFWKRDKLKQQRKAAEKLDAAIVKNLAVSLQELMAKSSSPSAKSSGASNGAVAYHVRSGRCGGRQRTSSSRRSGSTRVRVNGPRG